MLWGGGMESGGAQPVHAEVPVVEPGPAGPGGVEALAVDGSFSAIELIVFDHFISLAQVCPLTVLRCTITSKSESVGSYSPFHPSIHTQSQARLRKISPLCPPSAASTHLLSAHAVGGVPVAATASVRRHAGEACEGHSHATPWPLLRRGSHASSSSCGDFHGVISLTRRGACTSA